MEKPIKSKQKTTLCDMDSISVGPASSAFSCSKPCVLTDIFCQFNFRKNSIRFLFFSFFQAEFRVLTQKKKNSCEKAFSTADMAENYALFNMYEQPKGE
jgi:hypothetical protein